jgi:hypothetical protein
MQNKNIFASILFLFLGFVSMAQGATPPPPMPPPPPGLPIDDGIISIFILALVFGIYKTYKRSKDLVS